MTDDDRAKRIRTAALTVAVFAASGGAAHALFQAFRGAKEAPRISRVEEALPVPEYDFAYASDKAGDFDVYLATLKGDIELRLTDDPLGENEPAWSSDGTLIAYSILGDAGSNIWVSAVSEGVARMEPGRCLIDVTLAGVADRIWRGSPMTRGFACAS